MIKHPNIRPGIEEAGIRIFTFENKNGTRLTVSNYGAAVLSLWVKDKNEQLSDVVLGYQDIGEYLHDQFYMGTVIGRYANRIAGDTVKIDNIPYRLSVRAGNYHLHGGACGFNKKIFDARQFNNADGSGCTFTYVSPHLEEGFPGELVLEVSYTLDDADNWIVEYKAVTTKTTLINVTQHAYFNLYGRPDVPVDDHWLSIKSGTYLPVNSRQVPTGKLAEVANTPFDFTTAKRMGQHIRESNEQLRISHGYDHSWVLENKHTPSLKHAAVVDEPQSGRRMDVYTTEPAIHFYSGNFLDKVPGKNGVIYNKRSGFCLETQHFPDAPNHPAFPSTVLKAGEIFFSKTIFKFSTC